MIEKIRKMKLAKGLCLATVLVAMFLVWGCDDSDKVADTPPPPAKFVAVTGTINPAGGSITADPEDTVSGKPVTNCLFGSKT